MGLGRLRHAGPCSLPASRAHDRVVLRLVEHLRSSGRAGPAYGGHHQPATALACHRHAGAACETNNDHRSEFTREGDSGREGVSRCRHFFARAGKKCGAVDGPATLAANPRKSLSSFPSGPSVALAATPRARLTQQLLVEKSQKSAARPTPTAGFRMTQTRASPTAAQGAWSALQAVAQTSTLQIQGLIVIRHPKKSEKSSSVGEA